MDSRPKLLIIFTFQKNSMKNIIVTGTSRGIGYELALRFADAGHHVLALSRKIPKALLDHQNISCLSVDLANEQNLQPVAEFLSAWKTVDAIVHNAGALVSKPFSETTSE